MLLLSTEQIAEKWGISGTRVRQLATAGRIKGAFRIGRAWLFDSKAEVLQTAHQKKMAAKK